MPGRKYEAQSGYRYGFNGKEKDKDLNSLTAYDYGFRIYNPGIGKFLSEDPLTESYPWYTPYQFAGNKPIWCIDLDGSEEKVVTTNNGANGKKNIIIDKADSYRLSGWTNLQRNLAMAFSKAESGPGYEWISGYTQYKAYMAGDDINHIDWRGPGIGTLTIDATGKTIKLSYEFRKANDVGNIKTATFGESVSMGWNGFKTFFIKPDPLVEGSTAFKETFDNFLSGISLALGTGSLSKAASFWQKAGVANDIDDLLQISESSIQDENVKTAINLFKTITGIKNVTQSGTEMMLNGKANPSILGGTTLDVKDVIDGMTKAKELQDQKKANEAKAKESKSAKSQTSSMRSQHCNL